MPKCFICGSECYWGNDFSFEDYGMDGEGIVSNWTCSGCHSYYEIYNSLEEEEEEKNEGDQMQDVRSDSIETEVPSSQD